MMFATLLPPPAPAASTITVTDVTCAACDFSSSSIPHTPVLPYEVIEYLAPQPGERYLDGTVGLGGHSSLILESARSIELCCLDRDLSALSFAKKRLAQYAPNVHFFHQKYAAFESALDKLGWETINGALLDIGVSSMQIDQAGRGFSFQHDGPLDMRMDATSTEKTASQLVNTLPFPELCDLIRQYGEDPQAGRIGRAIVEAREKAPITTTKELAHIIDQAYPAKWRATARNHPATRTFQALRMVVNDELGQLQHFLQRIIQRLAPEGRLVIICFHSLEDRMVKHSFKDFATECICPPQLPQCTCNHKASIKIITKKPVTASAEELQNNNRSSSAKLRAAVRLNTPYTG